MRLVGWNASANVRHRSFQQNVALLEAARCRIRTDPRWFEIGDHWPVILDIDDAALSGR
jgi:hypothetical protein